MFGLPTLFAQSGAGWGSVIYWLIVGTVLVIHMAYAELQAKAGSKHDLAGIAKRSLGVWGWRVAMVVYPISVYGATLIYLLLGAQFLSALSAALGGPVWTTGWQLVLWLFFAWGARTGLKHVAKVERQLTFILVAGLALVCCLAALNGKALPSSALLPGSFSIGGFIAVVFFASISLPVIAEVMAFDKGKSIIGRRAILIGSLFAATLKWVFALSFAAEARNGMVQVTSLMTALPAALSWLLPFVGLLAISGAAVSVLDSLKTVYEDEFNFRPSASWLLAILPPLVLIFIATQSILPLMAFLGSFVASTNALIVCLSAMVERTRLIGRVPRVVLCGAIGLCVFTLAHTFFL